LRHYLTKALTRIIPIVFAANPADSARSGGVSS
jgi:hypothetical protein